MSRSKFVKGVKVLTNSAFIIIDMQNDYCKPDGVFAEKARFPIESIPAIYPRINRLVEHCRKKSIPVVWVKMIWDNDEEVGLLAEKSLFLKGEGLRRGTWGAEIVKELQPETEDLVVEKKRFSAFYETDLHEQLQSRNIEQLIFAGVRTDFCVESSVREAFFRDYKVIVAEDCVAGYFIPLHENSLMVMNTVFAQVKHSDDIISAISE